VMNTIEVIETNENNLKNVSISIEQNKLYGICGVSGSGKSTLACDVIARYALNNFSLSMPTFLRKRLFNNHYPNVKKIKGLPPVILIDIKSANKSVRSTVATVSGLMTSLRNIFAHSSNSIQNDNNKIYPKLFSYNIPENEDGGACAYCNGTGSAESISTNKLFGNEQLGVFNGGFSVVNEKGVKYTKVSDLFVKAFCEEHNISLNKKINEFSKNELTLLLYGSDKVISFNDRTGSNNGRKSLAFPGVIGTLLDVYTRTKNKNIEKLVSTCDCPKCHGTRYNKTALHYRFEDKTIADYLSLSISELFVEINKWDLKKHANIKGAINELKVLASELENIGVGYLELNRHIASVSGGELQRVRLAKQISMKLSGYCYVVDEPSTGLHFYDISYLIKALYRLRDNDNTVLVIEHNKQILAHCDCLIELGPSGGKNGGYVIATGTQKSLIEKNTLTGKALSNTKLEFSTKPISNEKWVKLKHITLNNLKDVELKIPLHSFVCISGVSGSGKSSAIEHALYEALSDYTMSNIQNKNLTVDDQIKKVVMLHQDASVIGYRSTVATLLDIMSYIRTMFANVTENKGWVPTDFAANSNGKGVCVFCKGLGVISDDDGLRDDCPVCDGTGFSTEALKIKYNGYNIAEIMKLSIDELKNIIDDEKIKHLLSICQELGLGYLSLGRNGSELSKGEYQRLRIANEIYNMHEFHTLIILDEPSRGLHYNDIQKLIICLRKFLLKGHSIIVIEHNLNVILQSDYIIEFGPYSGDKGGKIVYEGLTTGIKNTTTHTAKAISLWNQQQPYTTNTTKYIKDSYIIPLKTTPLSSFNEKHPENIKIEKNRINIIRGSIASGKTQLMRKLLYANPLKKYIASISTQGKYLTRNIEAWKNDDAILPLARIIDSDQKFYWNDERIIETLNLNQIVSKIFFCDKTNSNILFKNTFDTSKKTGKCSVCKGAGRLYSYDFNKVFSNNKLLTDFNTLISNRSRFNRIQPLLNKIYNIDISKPFNQMTYDEKRVFIFGDKDMEVFYAPKNKTYTWDGCNAILFSNISYASKNLRDTLKPTYSNRECSYCNGLGVDNDIANSRYRDISYSQILTLLIKDLLITLNEQKKLCIDGEELVSYLKTMVKLNLGHLRLGDYINTLDSNVQSIIQYISYKFNPLCKSLIIWDNFSAGKSIDSVEILLNDIMEELKNGVTIILIDNNISISNANNIILNSCDNNKSDTDFYQPPHDTKHGCFFEKYINSNEIIDREKITLSNKTTIGSITGSTTALKNKFKDKFNKDIFSTKKSETKCEKCDGRGWYEINLGDIGFNKCLCHNCIGSGFSSTVLKHKINNKNIAELLQMPVGKLYDWAIINKHNDIVKRLEVFINLGIKNIPLSQGLSELSYNEASMILIAKFLNETNPVLYIKNSFRNVYNEELIEIQNKIYKACIHSMKKIVFIKGDKI